MAAMPWLAIMAGDTGDASLSCASSIAQPADQVLPSLRRQLRNSIEEGFDHHVADLDALIARLQDRAAQCRSIQVGLRQQANGTPQGLFVVGPGVPKPLLLAEVDAPERLGVRRGKAIGDEMDEARLVGQPDRPRPVFEPLLRDVAPHQDVEAKRDKEQNGLRRSQRDPLALHRGTPLVAIEPVSRMALSTLVGSSNWRYGIIVASEMPIRAEQATPAAGISQFGGRQFGISQARCRKPPSSSAAIRWTTAKATRPARSGVTSGPLASNASNRCASARIDAPSSVAACRRASPCLGAGQRSISPPQVSASRRNSSSGMRTSCGSCPALRHISSAPSAPAPT